MFFLLKERIGDTAQLTDALHRVTHGELVLGPTWCAHWSRAGVPQTRYSGSATGNGPSWP